MAECKQNKVSCVEVKEALNAIQKYMHVRLDEIKMEQLKRLDEEIKPEGLNIIQSMKNMHLEKEDPVSVKRLDQFLKYEAILYNIYVESLKPQVNALKNEMEAMVHDCLKFFKSPFWEPGECDFVPEPKCRIIPWSWICMAAICLLFVIGATVAFSRGIVS